MSKKTGSEIGSKKIIIAVSVVCAVVLAVALVGLINRGEASTNVNINANVGSYPLNPASVDYHETNSRGQTFGSLADAISPETEPDLILVEASNGTEGYIRLMDFRDGVESVQSGETEMVTVNVYDSEGNLIEDTFFEIGGQ